MIDRFSNISEQEQELLISTIVETNCVFKSPVEAVLREMLEDEFFLSDKFDAKNIFIRNKRQSLPANIYGRCHAPTLNYWKFKDNGEHRTITIPNPLFYYTFVHNISVFKPTLLELYNFYDEKTKDFVVTVSRFINNEKFVDYNFYTEEEYEIQEGDFIKIKESFEKRKKADAALRSDYLYKTKVDVQNCYSSIYVHEITRLLNRELYKKFSENSGEVNEFLKDFLVYLENFNMMLNNGQTNGIITGPYSSFVTSELIFMAIDFELVEYIKQEQLDLKYSRYADDYIICSNTETTIDTFIDGLTSIMRKYSLSLNRSKIEKQTKGIYDGTPQKQKQHYVDIVMQIFDGELQTAPRVLTEFEYIVDELGEMANVKMANNILTEITNTIRKSDLTTMTSGEIEEQFLEQATGVLQRDTIENAITIFKILINKAHQYPLIGEKILILTNILVTTLEESSSAQILPVEYDDTFFTQRREAFKIKYGNSILELLYLKVENQLLVQNKEVTFSEESGYLLGHLEKKSIKQLNWEDINIKIMSDALDSKLAE